MVGPETLEGIPIIKSLFMMVKGHPQTHDYGSTMQNCYIQQHLVLGYLQTHNYAQIQERLTRKEL